MKFRSIKLQNVEISVFDEGPDKGQIDEIFVRLPNGECVFHLERMSERHIWAVAYDSDYSKEIHMDFFANPIAKQDDEGDDYDTLEITATTRTENPEDNEE